jgi:hypothetical protein
LSLTMSSFSSTLSILFDFARILQHGIDSTEAAMCMLAVDVFCCVLSVCECFAGSR